MSDEKQKYHFLYKTTRFDGYYYYGVHSTDDLEDGYLGSGTRLRRSIRKYGYEAHTREILKFHDSRESVLLHEKELVNEELLKDPLCLNLALGGGGGSGNGWYVYNQSEKFKVDHLGAIRASTASIRKKLQDPEYRRRFSERISLQNKKCYFDGRRENSGCFSGNLRLEMARRSQLPEIKQKRKETYKKIGHQQGETNSQYGVKRSWINKNGEVLKVLKSEVDQYLLDGWQLGIKDKNVPKPPKLKKPRKGPNLSELACVKCGMMFKASQRDIRRNRRYCTLKCFSDRNK